MSSDLVKIVVFVPISHADLVREAMGKAGAGKIGNYSHCSFSSRGVGRFMPEAGAQPFIGGVGVSEAVEEERIETICSREILPHVVEAIKVAHPYEEVAIDVFSLLSY